MLEQFRSNTAFILDNWRQILSLNNAMVFAINVLCIVGGIYGYLTVTNELAYVALFVAAAGGIGILEAILGRLMGAK